MTQEEKFKEAKRLYETANADQRYVLESLFPELKESKDERIRKALLEHIVRIDSEVPLGAYHRINGVDNSEIIAWLEKQGEKLPPGFYYVNSEGEKFYSDTFKYGDVILHVEKQCEQKSFDYENANIQQKDFAPKDEPKFKIGDWIINRTDATIMQIINNKDFYESVEICGQRRTDSYNYVEWDFRLWTIEDAKDGDVLCTYECDEPKIVFILKGTPKKHYALSYHCYYNIMYPHFASDSEKGCLAPNDKDVKPATKEQRDSLLKAIADAGYTIDFDKKELKKIEQKSQRMISAEAKETLYDKPTWKPSDEQIHAFEQVYDWYNDNFAPSETLTSLYNDLKKLKRE